MTTKIQKAREGGRARGFLRFFFYTRSWIRPAEGQPLMPYWCIEEKKPRAEEDGCWVLLWDSSQTERRDGRMVRTCGNNVVLEDGDGNCFLVTNGPDAA